MCKDHNKKHHPLDLNTLKGHGDSVTGLFFSHDGRSLATACTDGVVRVFKLDDASSKSFKFLRINVPAGAHPVAVAFSDDGSSVVVAHTHCLVRLYIRGERKRSMLPMTVRSNRSFRCQKSNGNITKFMIKGWFRSWLELLQLMAMAMELQLWPLVRKVLISKFAWKDRKDFGECGYKSIEKHNGYSITKWTFHCCCSFYCRCEGDITWIAWAPKPIPTGDGQTSILATASVDKKVKGSSTRV